ncbi:hypothetical protein BGW42_000985 [Actinomortierella wolfii]|nr:hypothetical protein BGW42_000985 [Actinomortierella wolfii]
MPQHRVTEGNDREASDMEGQPEPPPPYDATEPLLSTDRDPLLVQPPAFVNVSASEASDTTPLARQLHMYPSQSILPGQEAPQTRDQSQALPARDSSVAPLASSTQPHQLQHFHASQISSQSSSTLSSPLSSSSLHPCAEGIHGPIPLSQSVIPAPPPRLLHFQSREPSPVPECPFPLCRKPIALTKTRLERGVVVWLMCGILLLLNTYWTTYALMSHFAPPKKQQQQQSPSLGSIFLDIGRSIIGGGQRGSSTALPQANHNIRHTNSARLGDQPTVATVSMLKDQELSTLQLVFRYLFSVTLAIIRWWLCLLPLLIRPLFDTVHSCPHPHPYPYPEPPAPTSENDQQSSDMSVGDHGSAAVAVGDSRDQFPPSTILPSSSSSSLLGQQAGSSAPEQRKHHSEPSIDDYDEKRQLERLYSHDWAPKHQPSAPLVPHALTTGYCASDQLFDGRSQVSAEDHVQESIESPPVPQLAGPVSRATGRSSIKHRKQKQQKASGPPSQQHNPNDGIVSASDEGRNDNHFHKSEKPSFRQRLRERRHAKRVQRMQRKIAQERERVIRMSQDIGRYSLLYTIGSWCNLGTTWKKTVLQPGKIVADED